ncbi:hypothetical protein EJB05_00853, partial [Eragrostis curvula]
QTARCSISSPLMSMEAVSNSWSISDKALLSIELINNSVNSQDATIVQNIVERSHLCLNPDTYSSKASKVQGFSGSLVVYIMQEMEKSHAKAGRYKCPAEIPFFPETLLEPLIPTEYPSVLHMRYTSINLNKEIWEVYFGKMLPKLVKHGKDGHNGPSAVCDAKILQGLSKRIHYSMFLAEAKFRKSPDIYESAIKEQDPEKLRKLLKDPEDGDEFKRQKQFRTDVCQVLMNSGASMSSNPKLKPEMVVELFDEFVIPMAMEVQIQYLLFKAHDDNVASAHARETLQLKALSKRKQWLVKAGPPVAWTAKIVGVLVTCIVLVLRHKVLDMLMKKGVVSQETVIAALTMFLLTKEILEALKKGKEYMELIRFYVKFWERDK